MAPCAIHQKCCSTREEAGASTDRPVESKSAVVCPKPRRFSLLDPSRATPFIWLLSNPPEDSDVMSGNGLLDIILPREKDGLYPDPFFSGSPPSRVSNPVIQDSRFGDEKLNPVSLTMMSPPAPGRGRANFGSTSPAVRIEGFDCVDRDNRRSCSGSVPALA